MDVVFNSFLPSWDIDTDHELSKAAFNAYHEINGKAPETTLWDFSTNGVASAKMGIPTIGYGPGDEKLAHCKDEFCPVEDIIDACQFYMSLVDNL